MPQLVGYGVYLPRYRIALSEIQAAWGRSGGRGEKTVVPPDEDPLTLGVKAAQAALAQAGVDGQHLNAVLAASTSTGYVEGALAASLAYHLGSEGDVFVADFGLSARAITAAIRAGLAALSEPEGYAVVVAAEDLTAEPGSSYELSCSGGAGALLFSHRGGFAEVVGFASHTSGFVGRFRREGRFHGPVDDRFVMQQFLAHTRQAVERLRRATDIPLEEVAHVVLQAPEGRWASRAMKQLGLPADKLISTFPQVGYAGCASLLIDLAWALERSGPGDLVLAVSFGPGGSDALALRVIRTPPAAGVAAQLETKELVRYPTYLRYHGLLGGERR
jgi:hydroxymethylglutaryl-CoA synthase